MSSQLDLTKTTEWSLYCVERKKQGLVLELENLQTRRAHRLIFSAAGTNGIQRTSSWTDGVYSINFKTNYPVNFESFNNNLALLAPSEGFNKNYHLFTIGWVATIKINQPHGDDFGLWNLYGVCRIEYGSGQTKAAGSSAFRGGVSVAAGDVTAAPGGGPHVGLFDGSVHY